MEHHDWATGRASARSQGFGLQVSSRVFPVEPSGVATYLDGGANSVAFSPDGNSLVSGSLDRSLRVWDLSGTKRANQQNAKGGQPVAGSGTCAHTLTGHKVSCSWSCPHRRVCCVLNYSTRVQDYVLSVGVTPDGRWVVSGSKDRSIQFWNADQEQAHLMLQGHKNSGEFRDCFHAVWPSFTDAFHLLPSHFYRPVQAR
jgi:WD40 repeat protein